MLRKLHWVPIALISCLLTLVLFSDWVKNANTKVIEPYGDGFKAYLAILHHARYDSTFSWYEGMNYPFGEHIVPGASQPIYSMSMQVLEAAGIPAAQSGWAVIHFSILLGIVLATVFTYLLLRRLGVVFWVSMLAAILLTLMAPQVHRIVAHYGLAHLEVLPVVLYFLHRWHERPGSGRALAVALCVVVFSLIHFYYFAILAFTIGGFLAAHWLIGRAWKRWGFYALQLGIMFILPAVGFYTWFGLTDPTEGRNDAPYGFSQYQSHPKDVFASHLQPHWKLLLGERYPEFESWAYVGLAATLFFFFLLARWLYRLGRVSFVPANKASDQHFLNALMLTGVGLLLFSWGFPIDELGAEQFMEHLGPLKQFRSVGRFAWLFYYAIGISLWVMVGQAGPIDRMLGGKRTSLQRWLPYSLLGMAILLATLETTFRWKQVNTQLQPIPDLFENPLADRMDLDFSRFQAIIPVPYYNIGSDNYWYHPSGLINQKVQILNWQTGLSTTAAMLTRTSLDQTLKQLQLVTEPYRRPRILDDLPNDKPFLVLVDSLRWPDFGNRTNFFSDPNRLLFSEGVLQAYELPLESFEQRISARIAELQARIRTDSNLIAQGDFLVSEPQPFYYDDFKVAKGTKESEATAGYVGNGLGGDLGEGVIIFSTQDTLPPDNYLFSFWMDISQQRHTRAEVHFNITHTKGSWIYSLPIREHLAAIDNNGWGLIEMPLPLEATNLELAVEVKMPLLRGQTLKVDDVLLRPASLDLIRSGSDTIYLNNRYFPAE